MITLQGENLKLTLESYEHYLYLLNCQSLNNCRLTKDEIKQNNIKIEKLKELIEASREKLNQENIEN